MRPSNHKESLDGFLCFGRSNYYWIGWVQCILAKKKLLLKIDEFALNVFFRGKANGRGHRLPSHLHAIRNKEDPLQVALAC